MRCCFQYLSMTETVNILTDEQAAGRQTERDDPVQKMHALLASRVGALRKKRRLSFDQLAAQCGVSKGMLVQVEQGKANPSIGTLCRIAAGLGVSVAELIEVAEDPDDPVRIVAPGSTVPLWNGPSGGSALLLVGSDGPEMLEQWMWELYPGERFVSEAHPVGTQELLHVLEGELGLEIAGAIRHVPSGASVFARTDYAHAYLCAGDEKVRFVMTVWEPVR
jgi:DNA-binding XRE family transcriptional regulator/quercetin dioxygenase-like cupin family protein